MNSPELILALISAQALMEVIILFLALSYVYGKLRRDGPLKAMQGPVFLLALGCLTALVIHYVGVYTDQVYTRRWRLTTGPIASTILLFTLCLTFFLASWHEIWAERRRDLRELRWRRKHG